MKFDFSSKDLNYHQFFLPCKIIALRIMRGKNDERIGKQQKEYDDGDVFFHT